MLIRLRASAIRLSVVDLNFKLGVPKLMVTCPVYRQRARIFYVGVDQIRPAAEDRR